MYVAINARQFCRGGEPRIAHRGDLLVGQRPHLEAQRKALAELELDAAAPIGGLEADHVPLDGAADLRAEFATKSFGNVVEK
jgi:hypothetical protein